jgi:hypothetical protein
MNRRPFSVLVAVAATLVALTGCGVLDDSASTPSPTPSKAAPTTGLGDSVKDAGDLPDPCTLLSEAEVTRLTGRGITRIDEDGGASGDEARFCQWQQPSGQLAVFLARTSADDFKVKIAEATPVDGVGEDAFELAGHLYVLYGTVSIDVYNRGDSDEENLAKAKEIVKVLIPKI